jgi:hypothetical protein
LYLTYRTKFYIMKTTLYRIVFVFIILSSLSCSSDDAIQVPDLTGAWTLIRVSGGILDVNIEFETSEVVWNFDTEKEEVFIQNTVSENDGRIAYSGLPGGRYKYELRKLEDALILFIDNTQVGIIRVQDDSLRIDTGLSLDGFLTEFKRL